MEMLNKNIEVALEKLDTSIENKEVLKAILYKEHINRERSWDDEAPKAIKDIMHDSLNRSSND